MGEVWDVVGMCVREEDRKAVLGQGGGEGVTTKVAGWSGDGDAVWDGGGGGLTKGVRLRVEGIRCRSSPVWLCGLVELAWCVGKVVKGVVVCWV